MQVANDEARLFMWPAIERLGDDGVKRSFGWMLEASPPLDHAAHLKAYARRATLRRQWQLFLQQYTLVLCPVSGEPPFAWGMDVQDAPTMARVMAAQESMFGVPVLGLPALSVPTGTADGLPTGVQLIGPPFREDLLLDAAELIEARCPPITPIDPR
jgi:amidase